MVLVLIFCTILIVLTLLIILFLLSTIKIKVDDYHATNLRIQKAKYKITISLYLLNKIKWLSVKLNEKKIHQISIKMHLDKIDIKKLERDFRLADIKEIAKIKPKLTFLDLEIKLGVDDVIVTTFIIPILCTIISTTLPFVTNRKDINFVKYNVEPIYNRKNVYYIKLNSNLEIKILNLLNSLYGMYKNRKNGVPEKQNIKFGKNKIECNV